MIAGIVDARDSTLLSMGEPPLTSWSKYVSTLSKSDQILSIL